MKRIIEFQNVRKEFAGGNIVANDNISFFIKKGEVHAIAGENGAGKSTLLSMLFGLHKPTSGRIIVNGKNVDYNSAIDAINDGMGMVHQHFQLVDKFTVAENIVLGNEKYSLGPQQLATLKLELHQWKKLACSNSKLASSAQKRILDIKKQINSHRTVTSGFLNYKKINQKINQLSKEYNFNIRANDKIATLTVGQQQKVEILKLLYKKSEILIFDEPTAMLTIDEIDQLLKSILDFKKQGKTIIIITHKLDEIKRVADRVSVLRKGAYIGTRDVAQITANQLSQMMVGYIIKPPQLTKVKLGKVVLAIHNLVVKKGKVNKLNRVSLEVKAGEIVAVAGVEGNGQTELVHTITGIESGYRGQILIDGLPIRKLAIKKRNQLLSNIPEDRHKYGMVLELKAYENIVLKSLDAYSQFGFLNRVQMLQDANVIIKKYDVRGTNYGNAIATKLSGGNQQKLVIGRELDANRPLVLSFQATRGLDIGAISYIHNQLVKQRAEGKAILLISYDLNEILQLADRVVVLNKGIVTGVLQGKAISSKAIGKCMASAREVAS